MVYIVAFLILPLAAMAVAWRFGFRGAGQQILVAVVAGAVPGAFLAMAATAMASAVSPEQALLRGLLVGSLLGLGSGLLGVALTRLLRSS
ncbi:MAG: hypothetical protein KDH88_05475 [Chromatiales bacterium]|nr:hypothetical protein [Chromatiales bacterium]